MDNVSTAFLFGLVIGLSLGIAIGVISVAVYQIFFSKGKHWNRDED